MFISRQEYDTVNARNVQLARENKELNEENKQLKELRKQEVHNNTILLNRNRKLEKFAKEIETVAYQNYGRDDIALRKVKELIDTFQKSD